MVCLVLLAVMATPAPSPKEADIRRLMELTTTSELAGQITQQMLESFKAAFTKVPDATWTELKKELTPDDLLAKIGAVYDRHFSHDDIKALIAFYETPLGKKLLKELPAVTLESLEVGQTWGRAMGQRMMERLEAKGYRLPAAK
ncbi:MAG: DUF2059 domain-containing protein [Myxococcota bacterium]|nr:DUF2059 domain-containing protein [Myxococcota bacterium]